LPTKRFSDRVLFAWAGDDMPLIRTVALLNNVEAIREEIGSK
jgi:hypothetical protein